MDYDIFSIQEKSSTTKAEAGKISANKNQQIQRHGVRRFENGKVFQTSRLGAATQDRLIADTKEWGGPGTAHEYGFAHKSTESKSGIIANEKYLQDFVEGLDLLNSQHPNFVFTGQCTVQQQSISLQSSYGLDLKTSGGLCEWYFTYQRKGSGNMIDGFLAETGAKVDVKKEIQTHSAFLKMQNKSVTVRNGTMPVLFVEALQPLSKLLESFYIHKYSEGAALYSGKLGETLFSDKITLVDSAYDAESGAIRFFDGEGTVRKDDLPLIEKGRFNALMSDLRFGKKFNQTSSGNGQRVYNRGVTLGPRSLRFQKGQDTWKKIVGQLDRCLIAMVSAGGDSNDLGEFSSPVQIGYIMEKGEVIGQAPQVTVKTSIENYLGKGLIGVSSDGFTTYSPSACLISEMEVLVN